MSFVGVTMPKEEDGLLDLILFMENGIFKIKDLILKKEKT